MINEYLKDQIEMIEDQCGELTNKEKKDIIVTFVNKYTKLADAAGIKVELILNNNELLFELDQYMEYDFEAAKEILLERLN